MMMRKTRAVHSKSRVGCRTCKKRRVKCDETKPYCTRCLSGNIICEGYGIVIDVPKRSLFEISLLEYKKTVSNIAPKLTTQPSTLPNLDIVECHAFDLFRSETVLELAGLRSAGFWQNVVLPACYSEPAILHASIGLACACKSRAEKKFATSNSSSESTGLIAVAEYNKSIRYLQGHIQNHTEGRSLRVILTTCVMFATLELFRGCAGKARMHLVNGRKLLLQLSRSRQRYFTTLGSEKETMPLYFAPKPECVEDYLVNIFAHMDLQATYFAFDEIPMLKLTAHDSTTTPKNSSRASIDPLIIPERFHSLHEANQYLVILINECLKFRGPTFDQTRYTIDNRQSNLQRQHLTSCLRQWQQAYGQPCFTTTQLEKSDRDWKSQSALMLIQHAWLSVMLNSSYIEAEETEFDSYGPHFETIVNYTSFIYSPEGEGDSWNRKHFSLELGLVPPLWWTVMKCRHPKIRHRAHWLLGQVGSEGLWDPIIMYQIGSETMLLEEGWEGEGIDLAGSSSSDDQNITSDRVGLSALIPLRCRISAAKVSDVDENQKRIQMTFMRKQRDADGAWTGEFEQIVREKGLEIFSKSQFVELAEERTISKWR